MMGDDFRGSREEKCGTYVIGVGMTVYYAGYWDRSCVSYGPEETMTDCWWSVDYYYAFRGDEEECWFMLDKLQWVKWG
jgi:hypothetical protein